MKVLKSLGGKPEASVIGSTTRTDCSSATLANSLLIRVLDYNDIYWMQDPSHPSDLIPAALSTGEREHRSGKDLITGIVLAYELEMRLCEFAVPGLRERKWHYASLTQFVSPVVAAKMLELNTNQMCNAIGISGCHNLTLGAVTAGGLTMMKNFADPLATQSGVMAALLAKEGFTGPEMIFEGKEGFIDTLGGSWDHKKVTEDLGEHFKIGECSMKSFPTEALTHSPLTAVLKLLHDHDLKAEEIAEVTVKTIARAADILADPSKYHPSSKETADHSLPFCIAAAIADGQVTLDQFTEAKFRDNNILDLVKKVRVEADSGLENLFPELKPAVVEILYKDRRHFECRVDYPKGDPKNPMSDEELVAKFRSNVSPLVDKERQDLIIEKVMQLEDLEDISELTQLLSLK